MSDDYACLKLENQLCFPLYVCSKEIVRKYHPMLEELDLTYTQYIVMMAMWEKPKCPMNDLGKTLYLDSGTLTPVLKSLESKGFISRERSKDDERAVIVSLTPEGIALRDRAVNVPGMMASCVDIDAEDAKTLYSILYKILDKIKE